MHATIEQLLAIRDHEPLAAGIKQHADRCLLCRERLDALILTRDELQRLPAQAPRSDLWPAILNATQRRRHGLVRRQQWVRYGGFGLAASALLAAILFVYQTQEQANNAQPSLTARVNAVTPEYSQPGTVPDATEPDLTELMARSARLETALHALPRRPFVTRASTAETIAGLQAGVALIDYQLNTNPGKLPVQTSRQLWQQRVDLMNSLVSVRYAEVQPVAFTFN